MSIGTFAIGAAAVSEQPSDTGNKKPPPRRQIVAQADQIAQPEAR
jgi:hypothetical protein